jgi:enamine deaminase RidA (YjgF/YER057c/UK114 family)
MKRLEVSERMSQAVIHGNTVYLAGQVCEGASVAVQAQGIVDKIDRLLAEAGTDKSKALSAQVWLTDIASFDEFNAVWDAWVTPGSPPCRACVEATLALPQFKVEVMLIAAL